MKFIVKRASIFFDKANPPCAEAKIETIPRIDIRTFHSPEEFDNKLGHIEGKWLSIGANHGFTEDGYIRRERGTTDVWTIEINTLEELLKFFDEYGDIVISRPWENDNYREILIYDDYIE